VSRSTPKVCLKPGENFMENDMKKRLVAVPSFTAMCFVALILLGGLATAQVSFADDSFSVVPFEFDPYGSHLVAAEWKSGIGCL